MVIKRDELFVRKKRSKKQLKAVLLNSPWVKPGTFVLYDKDKYLTCLSPDILATEYKSSSEEFYPFLEKARELYR